MRKRTKKMISIFLSAVMVIAAAEGIFPDGGSGLSTGKGKKARAAETIYHAVLTGQMDVMQTDIGEWDFTAEAEGKMGSVVTLRYSGEKACFSGSYIGIETDLPYEEAQKAKVYSVYVDGKELTGLEYDKITYRTENTSKTTGYIALRNAWSGFDGIFPKDYAFHTFTSLEIRFAIGDRENPCPVSDVPEGSESLDPASLATIIPAIISTVPPAESPAVVSWTVPEQKQTEIPVENSTNKPVEESEQNLTGNPGVQLIGSLENETAVPPAATSTESVLSTMEPAAVSSLEPEPTMKPTVEPSLDSASAAPFNAEKEIAEGESSELTGAPVADSSVKSAETPVGAPEGYAALQEGLSAASVSSAEVVSTAAVIPQAENTTFQAKNPCKKVKAAKRIYRLKKKGKRVKVVFRITAKDKKKKTTDKIKVKIRKKKVVKIVRKRLRKGKLIVVVKARKKGKAVLYVRVGKKRAKTRIRVKQS